MYQVRCHLGQTPFPVKKKYSIWIRIRLNLDDFSGIESIKTMDPAS